MKSKKLSKKLLSILLILVSVAVIIVSFVGIYLQEGNKLSNIIPNYTFGSEIDGVVEYRFLVDNTTEEKEVYVDSEGKIRGEVVKDTSNTTEEEGQAKENNTGFNIEKRPIKKNEETSLTEENFEKAKSIIEKRLENDGATEYSIRMDDVTGTLVVELSQNDNIQYLYQSALANKGKFEIIDYQTGVILLDRSHLKKAGEYTYYDQTTDSYTVLLQLELTDEGTNLLKEVSKKYVQYVNESGETVTDAIAIKRDNDILYKMYFDREYTESIINIPLAENLNDTNEIQSYRNYVASIANIFNLDELPIEYKLDTSLFVKSSLNDNWFKTVEIILIIFLVLITIVFLIKFKLNGLLAGVLNAAFIGTVTLVLRYLDIVITFSSLISLFGILVINIIFMKKYLNNLKNKQDVPFLTTLKSFYSIMVPVIIIAFVFTFFAYATVTGMGYVLFWGLLIQILFNLIISKNVLDV